MTTTVHLPDGTKVLYSLEPVQALICAYEQYGDGKKRKKVGNWSTWDYPDEPQKPIRVTSPKNPRVLSMGNLYAIEKGTTET
jgi:hypothetical protein